MIITGGATARRKNPNQQSDRAFKVPKSLISRVSFLPLTVMTLILGVFIALALKTQDHIRSTYPSGGGSSTIDEPYIIDAVTILKQQTMIDQLERENNELAKRTREGGPHSDVLRTDLQEARVLAGLTPVEGPGIIVTLQDSKKRPPDGTAPGTAITLETDAIIHDLDIQRVINELRSAGAEAFAVNDQRVVATTAIRCVGPAIQVNGVPLTPPYNIRAIGDPNTLYTALKLPGGIYDNLQAFDPAMINIAKSSSLTVPEFTGSTILKWGKPVGGASEQKVSSLPGLTEMSYAGAQ